MEIYVYNISLLLLQSEINQKQIFFENLAFNEINELKDYLFNVNKKLLEYLNSLISYYFKDDLWIKYNKFLSNNIIKNYNPINLLKSKEQKGGCCGNIFTFIMLILFSYNCLSTVAVKITPSNEIQPEKTMHTFITETLYTREGNVARHNSVVGQCILISQIVGNGGFITNSNGLENLLENTEISYKRNRNKKYENMKPVVTSLIGQPNIGLLPHDLKDNTIIQIGSEYKNDSNYIMKTIQDLHMEKNGFFSCVGSVSLPFTNHAINIFMNNGKLCILDVEADMNPSSIFPKIDSNKPIAFCQPGFFDNLESSSAIAITNNPIEEYCKNSGCDGIISVSTMNTGSIQSNSHISGRDFLKLTNSFREVAASSTVYFLERFERKLVQDGKAQSDIELVTNIISEMKKIGKNRDVDYKVPTSLISWKNTIKSRKKGKKGGRKELRRVITKKKCV
jgi:hypothetical protein